MWENQCIEEEEGDPIEYFEEEGDPENEAERPQRMAGGREGVGASRPACRHD
jgi:hypothetical protein